jgi:hypothetical protein
MPGLIRKISTKRRAKLLEGDLFYFDPASWELMVTAAMTKGDGAACGRQSLERIAKAKETRRRNREARQRAATDARAAVQKAERSRRHNEARLGPALRDRILAAMEPGNWYGPIDVAHLCDSRVRNVRAILAQVLAPAGLVHPELNPEWISNTLNVEPKKLWTLTPSGETERTRILSAVEAGTRTRIPNRKAGRYVAA